MSDTSIQQLFSSVFNDIDDELKEFKPLTAITKNNQLRPAHIFLGVVLFLVIISVFTEMLAHMLITLFAMIYPAYMSFKAIHHNQEDMRKKWMTYWVVFGFVTVFDKILSFVLFFLPAYYSFKILFFIWLFYPRTEGAEIIYNKVVRPNLNKITESFKKMHQQ